MDYDLLLKEQIVTHQTSYICTNYIPSAKIHKSIVKPREDSDKVKEEIDKEKENEENNNQRGNAAKFYEMRIEQSDIISADITTLFDRDSEMKDIDKVLNYRLLYWLLNRPTSVCKLQLL